MRLKPYIFITETDRSALERKIADKLQHGYVVHGIPFVLRTHRGACICQAMVIPSAPKLSLEQVVKADEIVTSLVAVAKEKQVIKREGILALLQDLEELIGYDMSTAVQAITEAE